MIAGAFTLSLLSNPVMAAVLAALEDEPLALVDLRRAVGSPPQTTFRMQLRELVDLGVLERNRQAQFPRAVGYSLTLSGTELLALAQLVEGWLASAPQGPLSPESSAGKSAVKALAEAWGVGLIDALAMRPQSLTQLSRKIPSISYPSLERRLSALRAAGLVEASQQGERGRPYGPTDWLRRAAYLLAAAARFERAHQTDRQDAHAAIQAILMLALPILPVPTDARGKALLVAQQRRRAEGDDRGPPEGVTVDIQPDEVNCVPEIDQTVPSWALGTPDAWLDLTVAGSADRIRFGGRSPRLATELVRLLARSNSAHAID